MILQSKYKMEDAQPKLNDVHRSLHWVKRLFTLLHAILFLIGMSMIILDNNGFANWSRFTLLSVAHTWSNALI